MKFFVPFTDPAQAEEMYLSLRHIFPAKPKDRQIFRIEYEKDNEKYSVQVGEIEPRYGGLVFAIFDYDGVFSAVYFEGETVKGKPKFNQKPNTLVLGREDVLRLVEFEKGLRDYPLKKALQKAKMKKR
jgi:hypothetical protein